MPRLNPLEFQGVGQTRRLEETGIVICSSAATVLPVTLDVPDEARGLQHCVQAWHSQQYRTALTAERPVLSCLHLSRYRRDARDRLSKDVQPLPDWFETIRLPVFCTPHALAVTWQPYKVCAMALHFGEQMHRGHYRMLARQGQKVWITDDNCPAQPISSEEALALTANTYLLWCRRC